MCGLFACSPEHTVQACLINQPNRRYKPNEKYNGKPNVFKLRFFKKVINAYAKSRGDKGAKVKHSINLYIAFTSWKRCAKWQDRLKEVAEHVEKKSAFGDFLDGAGRHVQCRLSVRVSCSF